MDFSKINGNLALIQCDLFRRPILESVATLPQRGRLLNNLFRRLTAPPSPKGKAFKNLDFKIKSLAKTITKDKISSAFPFGEGAEERGGRGYINNHLSSH